MPDKTNEIPAVRDLSRQLDLKGRTVTLDAMHAQHETMRILRQDCQAHYIVTAIKDNQPTILSDLAVLDWSQATASDPTFDKGNGRIDTRICKVIDLSGPGWDEYAALYGRKQAICITRERYILTTGKVSVEDTYCLTSLSRQQASPDELLAMIRGHWAIENKLHYVRDFTYDEDRCRAYVGDIARNLACLSNFAISIIRVRKQFKYIPAANRHYADDKQKALDEILLPLRRP